MDNTKALSRMPVTTSLPARRNSTSLARPRFAIAGQKIAAERTRVLLGCFPNGKPADPEIYTAAIASVLAQYPPEIVQRVTDPRTGIARSCKFMPTVAELVAACDLEMRPYWQQWKEHQQIEERERLLAAPRDPSIGERFNKLVAGLIDYCRAPDPLKKPNPDKGEPMRTPHGSRVVEDLARREAERAQEEVA